MLHEQNKMNLNMALRKTKNYSQTSERKRDLLEKQVIRGPEAWSQSRGTASKMSSVTSLQNALQQRKHRLDGWV